MGNRVWGLLAVVVFAGAGCAGGAAHSADPKPPTTTPQKVATSTTRPKPKPTPPYSFDNSVPPPPLHNTGTNYVAIINSLITYGGWLDAHHPDPTLASRITAPGSAIRGAYEHDLELFRRATSRGYEIHTAPNEVRIITALSDIVSARVREYISVQRVVKSGKGVTSEVKRRSVTSYLDVITKLNGKWFLVSVDEEP